MPRRGKKNNKPVPLKVKFAADSLARGGCEVLKAAQLVVLREQTRSEDDEHTALLQKMGRGERVRMADLKALYKPLTAGDMADTEAGWYKAPVAVATNRERYDLTDLASRTFASVHRTHVIRWPMEYQRWEGKPRGAQFVKDAIQGDPCFWQYFVSGADAYLVKNYAKKKGLINARKLVCVGLVPHDDDKERLERETREQPAGSVISLEHAPQYVTMEVDGADPKEWRDLTLVKGKAVIPLRPTKPDDWDKVTVYSGLFYSASRVFVRREFVFDLGFAATVHKAEGQTMDKLIIAGSKRFEDKREMTYASLYVALSRVRCRDDVRLLVHRKKGGKLDWDSLLYVDELRPDPSIEAYFEGFGADGAWDADAALASYEALAPERCSGKGAPRD